MISSLLPDIGNSELNSGPEDSDDDDLQAELETFNLVHRAPAEDEDNNEDRLMSDEVEAQKWRLFRSILGKGLRVLKHKLRSRSRTSEEDRRAVNNPTSLKDLARNVLGTVGDKLDPRDMEGGSDRLTSEEAEIEKLKIFKKLFKKVKKGVKKGIKIFRKVKPLFKSRRRSRDRDEDDDCRESYKYANIEYNTPIQTDGGFYNEREVAEIEGFRSFLVNALRLVDTKLRPRSRTVEEDRDAVGYPKKWTDPVRNFLDTLREKLEQRRNGDSTTENEPTTTEFPTGAVPYGGQPWTTDQTDMASQTQSLFRLFKKLWRRRGRNRSG